MNTITITSFSDYISYIEHNYGRNHLFRGLKKRAYLLIPKIGRSNYVQRCAGEAEQQLFALQDLEEQTMNEFIKMSVPHMDLRDMNPWDQWTIGQHHGLPTRFLDWTENPLIAAYFATEDATDYVAVCTIDRTQFNAGTDDIPDVFSLPDGDVVILHVPSYINARIIAQKGVFTVHKNPTKPLDQTKINGDFCCVDQLIIPKAAIREFVKDLDWFGINRSFIYPGLDGLAYYLDFKAKGGID